MMLIVNKITLEKPVFASYEIDGKPSEAGNKMDSTKVNVLYFFISFFFFACKFEQKGVHLPASVRNRKESL